MTQNDPARTPPVAIVAVEALFPGQPGKHGFWQDIVKGADNVTDVPPSHWLIEDYYDADPSAPDKTYCKRGGFIRPVPFDPLEFGVPPSALPSTDTAQLLALMVAKRVLQELAETQFAAVKKDRISVILGVTGTTELTAQMSNRLQKPVWVKALRESGLPEEEVQAACKRIADHYVPWQESSFPGLLGNVVAGRIANRLDLGGSNFVTDAACASSLAAIRAALDELYLGHSDVVITGGVDALNDILMYLCFSKTPAFSPSGKCRPFSDKADGTIISEGVGMFALRRLEDAERDGNHILAVIRGMGSASDGRATSVYAPRAGGQAVAMDRAYAQAGYDPETVGLVEAHGTGTIAGDAAEFEGLKLVFGSEKAARKQWCALGSIKSQVGHAKGAAGAAGLFKIAMALHHGVLPPTIQVDRPNPKLGIEQSPFYLNTTSRPWFRGSSTPRRASVSSFGFGGSNFHLTAEEYTGPGKRSKRLRAFPTELFLFSATDKASLATRLRNFLNPDGKPLDLISAAVESRGSFDRRAPVRLAVVADSTSQLSERLEQILKALANADAAAIGRISGTTFADQPSDPGRIAFLFPGQGSQYLNMGSGAAIEFDAMRQAWEQSLSQPGLEHLSSVVFPIPAFDEELRKEQETALVSTINAQPAIATTSLGFLNLLTATGVKPDALLGHSFGEVVALHAAGVFDAQDVARIALKRGEVMARAAEGNPGAMLAVSAGREELAALLKDWNSDLVIANDNAPSQVILSGPVASIESARTRLGALGKTAALLPVATAFHSTIVSGATAPFASFLNSVTTRSPALTVLSNTTAEPYPSQPETIRDLLSAQLAKPVRFREAIERLHASGVRTFIEVGPGTVLSGLTRKCLGSKPHLTVAVDRKNSTGITALLEALGQLAVAGVEVDAGALWQNHASPDTRWTDAPPHGVFISGTNVGRRYPPAGGATALPAPNPPAPPKTATLEFVMESPKPTQPSPDLQSLELFHRHASEAHREFQRVMAESHQAYLRTVASLAGGHLPPPPAAPAFQSPQPAPAAYQQPVSWAQPPAWTPPGRMPEPPAVESTPTPRIQPVVASPVPPMLPNGNGNANGNGNGNGSSHGNGSHHHAPVAPPAPQAPAALDPVAVLMSVVADSTGYPPEMLNLDMELEAGLGVDSIKQVEILSSLQTRIPGLPELKPAQLAQMKTLGQIVAYIRENQPGGSPPAPAGSTPSSTAQSELESESDLKKNSIEPVARSVTRLAKSPASGFSMPGFQPGAKVSICGTGGQIAKALVSELKKQGCKAAFTTEVDPNASCVVHLVLPETPVNAETGWTLSRAAFHTARTIAPNFTSTGGTFVTVQATGGGFGFEDLTIPDGAGWIGGIPGLVKTAGLEWTRASVKAIDLDLSSGDSRILARKIVEELTAGGPEIEVGLPADGTRRIPVTGPEPANPGNEPALPENAVVVVSGGGRGVTATTIRELASARRLRWILLGRTTLSPESAATSSLRDEPSLRRALIAESRSTGRTQTPAGLERELKRILAAREIQSTLAHLEKSGGQARYLNVDVTDATALDAALASVRQEWGPVSGIIHGAGVLADKRIQDKTDAQFESVWKAKVGGLNGLLEATRNDPLQLICLFSSVAGRGGNMGQSDYAMANEVLNKMARNEAHRRGPSCLVKSVNWGPWDGGMVDGVLKGHFEKLGVPLIPREGGARFLKAELDSGIQRNVEVIAGGALPEPPREWHLEIPVSPKAYPCLNDHQIRNRPVLPMVLAMEWFMRAGQALAPQRGNRPLQLRNVHVLRSGVLSKLNEQSERLALTLASTTGNETGTGLNCLLNATDGSKLYQARLEAEASDSSPIPRPLIGSLQPAGWTTQDAYSGRLFHGPLFQVIRSITGFSDSGGAGRLSGILERGWPSQSWISDPALLDGGMQLVLLWGLKQTGRIFLPTRIGWLKPCAPVAADTIVECEFSSRITGGNSLQAAIDFRSSTGDLLCQLGGVEMFSVEDPIPTPTTVQPG